MTEPTSIQEDVFATLQAGAVLLTANQRLARDLQVAYAAWQQMRGHRVWPRADILPLSTWLERCWSEHVDQGRAEKGRFPVLLNPHQERMLWERIIGRSPEGESLLNVGATAQNAQEAWQLLRQHRLIVTETANISQDARAFGAWARHFGRDCQESGWLDNASLLDYLADRLHTLPLPSRVWLAGFHEITPQQESLFTELRMQGCEVTEMPRVDSTPVARQLVLADTDSEIRAAAQWARFLLEQSPQVSIGIVVLDLAGLRARVERIFSDVLSPGSAMGEQGATLFHVSLGRPLAQFPAVQTALILLELAQGQLPLERAGMLLRSPFVGGAEEEARERALLDARLRLGGDLDITLETLRYHASGSGEGERKAHACPRLVSCLSSVEGLAGRKPALPSEWTSVLSACLAGMGWPGERALNSDEYQAAMAWRELLAHYRALDAIAGRQSLGAAVATLKQMAARTLFQPRQEEVPVQIMGVLEAAGLRFDHLWLLGFHDEAWPPPPRPNPFLPSVLQRQHGLPHASAERESAFCRRVSSELLASAPDVVISSAAGEGERLLRPSPLFAAVPLAKAEEVVGEGVINYVARVQASGRTETVVDETAPPLPEGASVPGGAALFKHQAACPFRAFALLRLGAAGLQAVQTGLSAAERGTLMHDVLNRVWERLGSHAALVSVSDSELDEIVRASVEATIRAGGQGAPSRLRGAFARLERTRLALLVHHWLVQEKMRAPFVVREREQRRAITMEGIAITTRIDRIDELCDGGYVIIDYKTGRQNETAWFGERPDEPQLPLYAVTADEPIAGLVFGQLVRGDMRLRGLARVSGVAPDVRLFGECKQAKEYPTWDAVMSGWRGILACLAREFKSGYAAVDPKDGAKTCRYCELSALCRIHEHDGLGLEEGDDE